MDIVEKLKILSREMDYPETIVFARLEIERLRAELHKIRENRRRLRKENEENND